MRAVQVVAFLAVDVAVEIGKFGLMAAIREAEVTGLGVGSSDWTLWRLWWSRLRQKHPAGPARSG